MHWHSGLTLISLSAYCDLHIRELDVEGALCMHDVRSIVLDGLELGQGIVHGTLHEDRDVLHGRFVNRAGNRGNVWRELSQDLLGILRPRNAHLLVGVFLGLLDPDPELHLSRSLLVLPFAIMLGGLLGLLLVMLGGLLGLLLVMLGLLGLLLVPCRTRARRVRGAGARRWADRLRACLSFLEGPRTSYQYHQGGKQQVLCIFPKSKLALHCP
jgi:hypothetical protein